MTAYIVNLRGRIKGAQEIETYKKKATAADSSKLKVLVLMGKLDTLEGAPFESVVILEFPTVEDAKARYKSPEYQAALKHRLKGADYQSFVVQGV
jgi:uncharacterized protein (DUF1330 family)